MKNLQEATERICDLKGSVLALDALLTALLQQLPPAARAGLGSAFAVHTEVARTVMLNTAVSETTLAAFDRDAGRMAQFIASAPPAAA